jgi:hypothetical protein
MQSPPVSLPLWLRVLFLAVAEAPWTGIKQLNALVATNITLAFLGVSAIFKWELNITLVDSVLIFLGSWLGITTLGQIGKRMTYKPSPPYGPDIEDAQAGATSTAEHPVPRAPAPPKGPAFGGKSR